MNSYYYLQPGGEPQGPYPETEVMRRLKIGEIRPSDLVSQAGWEKWEPISKIFPENRNHPWFKVALFACGGLVLLILAGALIPHSPFIRQKVKESPVTPSTSNVLSPMTNLQTALPATNQPPTRSRGRLGESENEASWRYGSPIQVQSTGSKRIAAYSYKGYLIEVTFEDNKSVLYLLGRHETKEELDDDECLALAEAIGGQGNWVRSKDLEFMSRTWRLDGTDVVAHYKWEIMGSHVLAVTTKEYLLRTAAAAKERAKAKASGL